MLDILFVFVFPLVLVGLILIIFLTSIPHRRSTKDFMSCDEFIKDWLKDHGQAHKVEEQFNKMKKDPSGKLYMPITYKGAIIFLRWGLTPNKVSWLNLILSFLIFYGAIMAGLGHSNDWLSVQPFYGVWMFLVGVLVVFTGIIDGIDGAIARLLDQKSKSGAWFDNVIDRVSDILMLVCLLPTGIMVMFGIDFGWMVWTNIFLIFIYEYMRARHEGLGLKETKPTIGERITRVLVIATFFIGYGASSLVVMITYLIDPSATAIFTASHEFALTWWMLIFQISLMGIMAVSIFISARYVWKNLKILDKKE